VETAEPELRSIEGSQPQRFTSSPEIKWVSSGFLTLLPLALRNAYKQQSTDCSFCYSNFKLRDLMARLAIQ